MNFTTPLVEEALISSKKHYVFLNMYSVTIANLFDMQVPLIQGSYNQLRVHRENGGSNC